MAVQIPAGQSQTNNFLGIVTLAKKIRNYFDSKGRIDIASRNSPGKAHREGISLVQLCDMFPTEESVQEWFEKIVWPNGRVCPRYGCAGTRIASATSPLPSYCRGCQKPFSVKIGTALQKSNLPLRKWVFAIYLEMTNLKGVSSMKLHR
ncbi:MAG: IS1595 family transposase, partial [Aestuariivita sp.]|nr:IS1595 family transposase [Aestuariivita sp.]MCY4203099.1 IS1595 family transposase [Aestuariivita sp.]MCY4287157.1 IS1595 family transposase [Aestuariivita sp.]MCY4347578.1 IS1595 family transposase [Aestuariivita sp.]